MYVHSVKLINYKSFGDYSENEVILEPAITAIIGMNESGKSNVLSGLSYVDPHYRNSKGFSTVLQNRNCLDNSQIKYHITLKTTPQDQKFGITGETTIVLSSEQQSVRGSLVEYCNSSFNPSIQELLDLLDSGGENPLQLQNYYQQYKQYIEQLQSKDVINIPLRTEALDFLCKYSNRIADDKKAQFKVVLDAVQEQWKNVVNKIPYIFYRNSEKNLHSYYTYEEVKTQFETPSLNSDSLLSNFIKILNISDSDFLSASKSGLDPLQTRARRRIQKALIKFNEKFNEFYKTEQIELDIDFNGGGVSFNIQSNSGEALLLMERSNGLRWYIDTFIDAQANNIPGKNVLYLFDEPGVFLHVNAQRELLSLFKHLASMGNQVVYTTHSPYMLDTENDGIHRIRAVVKDDEGYSRIYKTAYDSRISPEHQTDTLAPIIRAIGMNLCNTFGPATNKINIVTEGMSDYIYLSAMAKFLSIDADKYCIIPSVGARNSINICSILQGWGCPYIALFDYDSEGVNSANILRNDMHCQLGMHYLFVKDVTQEDLETKDYKNHPYMIEDLVTHEEIDNFCMKRGLSPSTSKALIAKLMANAIDDGSYICGNQCRSNFENLFEKIMNIPKTL